MGRVIHSLAFWGFMLMSSLVLFPVAVILCLATMLIDRNRRALHLFTCFWGSLYTWSNPAWRVQIKGRKKIDSRQPTIFVANHLSLLDVILIFRLFTHFKWVSKTENFKVPLIGWNMRLNQYIPVQRGHKASVMQMMKDSKRSLNEGNSLFIFPEGSRSPDGQLRSFRTGAFDLALAERVPIQPILIRGTSNALPKRGFILQGRHAMSVEVLDAIAPEKFESMTAEELAHQTRELIAHELEPPTLPSHS